MKTVLRVDDEENGDVDTWYDREEEDFAECDVFVWRAGPVAEAYGANDEPEAKAEE